MQNYKAVSLEIEIRIGSDLSFIFTDVNVAIDIIF